MYGTAELLHRPGLACKPLSSRLGNLRPVQPCSALPRCPRQLTAGKPTRTLVFASASINTVAVEGDVAATPGAATSSDKQEQAFQAMMQQPGFEGNVYLAQGPLGRGMFTADEVATTSSNGHAQPGTPISVSVNNTLCIVKKKDPTVRGSLSWHETYLSDWQQQHGMQIPEKLMKAVRNEKENELLRLSAWLLWSMNNTPFWRNYADTLMPPMEEPQSLMWATDAHIAAAQDPALITDACKQQVTTIRERVLCLLRDECGVKAITQEEVGWCMDLVTTRSIGMSMSSSYVFMVPLVDMANHSRSSTCHFYFDLPKGKFQIRHKPGSPPVPAGSELLVSYNNDLSSRDLLYYFGFITPGNPLDRVALPKDQLPQGGARIDIDLVVKAKRNLVQQVPPGDAVAAGRLDAAAGTLLAAVNSGWQRVVNNPYAGNFYVEQRREQLREERPWAMSEAPPADPAAVQLGDIQLLQGVLEKQLVELATTPEQDEGIMAGAAPLPGNDTLERQCVAYRLERKRILQAAIQILQALQQMVQAEAGASQ